MIGLGKRKGICSFICSLYYCELGHGKTMDDRIGSMEIMSPTEMNLGVMLREEQIAPLTPLTRSAFRLRSFQREIQNLSLFPRLMCPGQNIYLGKRVFSLCELTCFRPWVMRNWYLNPFPLILNFLHMHFCCYLFTFWAGWTAPTQLVPLGSPWLWPSLPLGVFEPVLNPGSLEAVWARHAPAQFRQRSPAQGIRNL